MPLRLGHDDLVLSHFSLPLTTPLPVRLAAAQAAGFAGFGFYTREYAQLRADGVSDDDIIELCRTHGLVMHEIDALPLNRLDHLDTAAHMAEVFRPHHVQMQGPSTGDPARDAELVAGLADRLAPLDVRVAIEFVGLNEIRTAAEAWDLVQRSGRDNVGVQADIWHHVRTDSPWSVLEVIPVERIFSVQLDDGPARPVDPDYLTDTVHHRCVPGAGEFPIDRFLDIVHPASNPIPISLEVIDDDLVAMPHEDAARAIAEATRALLARRRANGRG